MNRLAGILAGSALAASMLTAPPTQAQTSTTAAADWPTRPVRVVVGFAPGTPPDVFARMYGEYASKRLGTPFVVENRSGSAGNLGTDAVAHATADGYTILYNVSTAFTINPSIYSKLTFDPAKDLVPLATSMRQGLVLIAGPKLKATSLQALMADAKASPGTITHASYGAGSPSHLIMEWFKDQVRIDMVHVPYRTTPVPDLLGGQVDLVLEPMASGYPLIAAGKARALAYSGPERHPSMPDVPTFAEVAPELAMTSWHGFWAPAKTPAAIIERLHATFLAASRDPDLQRRIRDLSSEPLGLTREEMAAMVARDADIYGRLAKARNIRVD